LRERARNLPKTQEVGMEGKVRITEAELTVSLHYEREMGSLWEARLVAAWMAAVGNARLAKNCSANTRGRGWIEVSTSWHPTYISAENAKAMARELDEEISKVAGEVRWLAGPMIILSEEIQRHRFIQEQRLEGVKTEIGKLWKKTEAIDGLENDQEDAIARIARLETLEDEQVGLRHQEDEVRRLREKVGQLDVVVARMSEQIAEMAQDKPDNATIAASPRPWWEEIVRWAAVRLIKGVHGTRDTLGDAAKLFLAEIHHRLSEEEMHGLRKLLGDWIVRNP
jgi:hypothetical protein